MSSTCSGPIQSELVRKFYIVELVNRCQHIKDLIVKKQQNKEKQSREAFLQLQTLSKKELEGLSGGMQIFVKTLTGKTITLDVAQDFDAEMKTAAESNAFK